MHFHFTFFGCILISIGDDMNQLDLFLTIVRILKHNSFTMNDHAGFVVLAGLESCIELLKQEEHEQVLEFYQELADFIGMSNAHKLFEGYTHT